MASFLGRRGPRPVVTKVATKGFGDNTLWIITEADRSVTTFLLRSEY